MGNGTFEVPRKTLATRACLLETGSPRMSLPNNCRRFYPTKRQAPNDGGVISKIISSKFSVGWTTAV